MGILSAGRNMDCVCFGYWWGLWDMGMEFKSYPVDEDGDGNRNIAWTNDR